LIKNFFMMKKFVIFMVLIAIVVGVSGQDSHKGKVGLTATIQNTQMGVMLPIFITNDLVIAPALDFKSVQSMGKDFSFGIVPKIYLKPGDFMPYVGVKFGAMFYFPDDEETTIDFLAGLAFGGDYFFNEHFSIGVEAQGNFTKSDDSSDRFGNPGNSNFNLATMISASIFF